MHPPTNIQVRIIRALGLPCVNLVEGYSDPYCVLSIPRLGLSLSTPVCLNTTNPMWYHTLVFHSALPSDVLNIHLYDRNRLSSDVSLGHLSVSLGEALSTSAAILSNLSYTPSPPPPSNQSASASSSQSSHVPYSYTAATPAGATPVPPEFEPSAPPISPRKNGPKLQPSSDGLSSTNSVSGEFWRTGSIAADEALVADVSVQRLLTREYTVVPQGKLHLVVGVAGLEDFERGASKRQWKRFRSHRLSEGVGRVGAIGLKTKVGEGVGKMVRFGVEKVSILGTVADMVEPVGEVFVEFSTWKLDMDWVDDVFRGRRQKWNQDYVAAQRIFKGGGGLVARRVVQLQHAYLYGGSGVKAVAEWRKDMHETNGWMVDGKDFAEIMEYGVRRGKPRMFTYVLMEKRLYIAETGAKFFRDMMSKHAMHCSAATEVVYAGELLFQMESNGVKIVLDNNSGTYAPRTEDLKRVEEVFRRNFSGITVEALDFRDAKLEEYKRRMETSAVVGQVGIAGWASHV